MHSRASLFRAEDVLAARRGLAARSLSDFACMVDIPTVPLTEDDEEDRFTVLRLNSLVLHHRMLCDNLQALEAGLIPNLMVLMPPGSAKSTYSDVVFVPWFMSKRPRRNVILASYATTIARKQGRRARQLIRSHSFQNLMGTAVSAESSAADEWALTNGSEYMAGGILAGLTGNRAALGICDDLIAGRKEAESETIRNTTWDAYVDDFCSRLIPGAPQVMITTRWHEDDPAGRILPEGWDGESGMFDGRDGRRWMVLCMPAIADRADDPLGRKIGETLWPEWFSLEHWKPFQRNSRTWTSLYQQKPKPPDGTFYQRAWFKRFTTRPANLHIYMTSDHAQTPDGGDWSVFRVWGVDPDGHVWGVDGYRCQKTADKAMGVEIDENTGKMRLASQGALPLIKKWKPLCWFPENDPTWRAVKGFVKAAMRQTRTHCRIEALPTSGGSKETKAQATQGLASMGKLHLPEGLEWDQVIEEHIAFPGGKHDDEVDASANIGRALDEAHPALSLPTEEKKPSVQPFTHAAIHNHQRRTQAQKARQLS